MNLLASIQAEMKAHLDAQTYFSTSPVITIVTETAKSPSSEITAALAKTGLCVMLLTLSARDCVPQSTNLYWGQIRVIASVIENVTLNRTGQHAAGAAEAVVWHLMKKGWTACGPLQFESLEYRPDPAFPDFAIYEAEFTTHGKTTAVPART